MREKAIALRDTARRSYFTSTDERIRQLREAARIFDSIGDQREYIQSQLLISDIFRKTNLGDSALYIDSLTLLQTQKAKFPDLEVDARLSIFQSMGEADEALINQQFTAAAQVIDQYKLEHKRTTWHLERGKLLSRRSMSTEAIPDLEKARKLASTFKQDTLLGNIYCYLAVCEYQLGHLNKAIEHCQAAIQLQKQINDLEGLSYSYIYQALIYEQLGDLAQQKHFNREALAIFRQLNVRDGNLIAILCNIAITYRKADSALIYYNEAIQLAQTEDLGSNLHILQAILGSFYLDRKELDSAQRYFFLAKEGLENLEPGLKLAELYFNISTYYFWKNQITPATAYAHKALDIFNRISSPQALKAYKQLAHFHTCKGEHTEALNFQNKYISLRDSLFNDELNQKVTQIATLNEIDKKNAALKIAEQNSQLLSLKVKNQERGLLLISTISGLLLLLILVVLYFLRQKSRNEATLKTKNEHIRNLMHELSHRVKNNFQILSNVFSLQVNNQGEDNTIIKANKARVDALLLLHQKLTLDDSLTHLNPVEYITELTGYLMLPYGFPAERLRTIFGDNIPDMDIDRLIPLGLIVNELVSNSLKHAFPGNPAPELLIRLEMKGPNSCQLVIKDNGNPQEAALQKRENNMGMRLLNIFVKQLQAQLSYKIDKGLEWTLEFSPRGNYPT